jgi:hypothetical protein
MHKLPPAPKKRKGRVVAKYTMASRDSGRGYYVDAPTFTLPADAASVERMREQVAECIAGTSGTNMSDDQVAEVALAAIGIKAKGGAS